MARIKPFCMFVARDDVLQLPSETIDVVVPAADRRQGEYETVLDSFDADEQDAGLRSIAKLRQLASGILPDDPIDWAWGRENVETTFDAANPKTKWLIDFLEDLPSHERVWASFHAEIDGLKRALDPHVLACVVDGRVPEKLRPDILEGFRRGKHQVLIANPSCIGHGVTLTECRTVVFHSLDHSSEKYVQARDRVLRIGQDRKVLTYRLMTTYGDEVRVDIDRACLQCVEGKLEVSDLAHRILKRELSPSPKQ